MKANSSTLSLHLFAPEPMESIGSWLAMILIK